MINKEKKEPEKEFIKSIEEFQLNPRTFIGKCQLTKNDFKTQITMIKYVKV